jgi:hypothetical protein
MTPAAIIGMALIMLGVVGLLIGGFSYTHEKPVAQIGPVEIDHKSTQTMPIPPLLSAVVLLGGIGLVVVGAKS